MFQSLIRVFEFERGLKNNLVMPDIAGAEWSDADVVKLSDVLDGLAR